MDNKNWLKVSLTTTPELAEAVAEVFSRFALNGVIIESIKIKDEIDGPGTPVGPVRVSAYLLIDDGIEGRKLELEKAVSYLRLIQSLPELEFESIQEKDWMEAWKEHFNPIEVGEKFLIIPSWVKTSESNKIIIKIDPGMAFGTGSHPSTQLCMQMMENQIEQNQTILDIGCGSGILSIAAIKLGAEKAYGVDIDLKSLENAHKNARLNEVDNQVQFDLGSVNQIKEGLLPIKQAPVVVVNILAYIQLKLVNEGIVDLVEPNGLLILSGILTDDEENIIQSLESHSMDFIQKAQIDDWVGLIAKKN